MRTECRLREGFFFFFTPIWWKKILVINIKQVRRVFCCHHNAENVMTNYWDSLLADTWFKRFKVEATEWR